MMQTETDAVQERSNSIAAPVLPVLLLSWSGSPKGQQPHPASAAWPDACRSRSSGL